MSCIYIYGSFAGYRLKKPIPVKIYVEDDVHLIENEELELRGCGKTIGDAVEDLKVVFKTLVEEYLLESEDNLTKKAVELKNRLSEYVAVT